MRYIIASLLIVGCVSSTAIGFQARGGGPAAGKACALLTRDLLMKVSTAEGRKLLEGTQPSADAQGISVAKGASVCYHGLITLVLEPAARPELPVLLGGGHQARVKAGELLGHSLGAAASSLALRLGAVPA